jgi:hypothetical protein
MTRTTNAAVSSARAERVIDTAASDVPSVGRWRRQLKAPSATTIATTSSFAISA